MSVKNIHKILVPIAFSKEGEILLKQAMFFHEVFSCQITMLFVVPEVSLFKKKLYPLKYDPQRIIKKATKKLSKCCKAFFNGQIPDFVELKVKIGDMVPEVLNIIQTKDIDLVIIKECKKIKCLLSNLNAGSQKVVKYVSCPVMIIHEKWTQAGINKILVPIDVTKNCRNVVLWAAALAKKLKAEIQIVSIVKHTLKLETSLVYKRANLVKKWIIKQGIKCDLQILRSVPGKMHEALLKFAEEDNADLIMILTHKKYFMANNYLGKFANDVIHQSPKPVLSVVTQNKSLFNVVWDPFKYGKSGRVEHLNISENDIKN